jgi:hypothetical protein
MVVMTSSEYTRTQVLRFRPSYLANLQRLVGRAVRAEELLSPTETMKLPQSKMRDCPKETREFRSPFVQSDDWKSFVAILQNLNSSPISIWIEHTRGIGTLVVPELSQINFTEVFKIPGQLAVFMTLDGRNKMLLTDEVDDKAEVVELQGFDWSNAFDIFIGGSLIETSNVRSSSH